MITYKELTEAVKINKNTKVKIGDRVIYTKSGKNGVVTGIQNRAGSVVIKFAGNKMKEVEISKLEPASGPYKKNYTWEI
jgi:ethanolamine utilization microcompartment shell protein EutL